MANFRQIHVSIWKDPWFLELEPPEKLLFVYLFSNESTSLAGIYELAFRVICFETGLDKDFVRSALDKFTAAGKVYYENGILWVTNMRRYNATTSSKVMIRIEADLDKIPECPIKQRYIAYYQPNIPYQYPIGTSSLKEEEEKEEEKEKEAAGGDGDIYKAYEQNIGHLTPIIADNLKDLEADFPKEWILEAIDIAVGAEKRSLNYVRGILKNRHTNGKSQTKGEYIRPASEVY